MHCNLNFRIGSFLALVSLLFINSCRPDNTSVLSDSDDNGGYASDASRIEWVNNDVISIADVAGTIYNGAHMRTTYGGICATVGVDTFSSPHVLVIRFGSEENTCTDGRRRKGAIIVKYDGRYNDTAQIHTITFDNYFINGNQLTGSIQTTRVDTTVTGNWYYKVFVNDSLNMAQYPLNSQFVTWKGNLVRKWLTGHLTADRFDDVFSISGSTTMVRPNGHQYSVGISTPWKIALTCDYVQSGVANITGYNGARRLDYGTGDCDANANLYIGVNSYGITLTK